MIQNAKEGNNILEEHRRLSSRTVIEQTDKIIGKEDEGARVEPERAALLSVPVYEDLHRLPTPVLDEGQPLDLGVGGPIVANENATRLSEATQREDLSKGIHREDSAQASNQ